MKIKLKDKKIKVPIGLCFRKTGYDQTLIDEINSGKSVDVDKIHPSGTIGYQMGVVNSRDAGTVNRSRGNVSFGFEDYQVLREATTPDALQTTLNEFRNQPIWCYSFSSITNGEK